jgi:hypothetical protein
VSGFVPTAAETPAGNPEIVRVTGPLKFTKEVMVAVVVPVEPWFTLRVFGKTETEKSPVSDMPMCVAFALLKAMTITDRTTKRADNRFDFRIKPIRFFSHLWLIYFSVVSVLLA